MPTVCPVTVCVCVQTDSHQLFPNTELTLLVLHDKQRAPFKSHAHRNGANNDLICAAVYCSVTFFFAEVPSPSTGVDQTLSLDWFNWARLFFQYISFCTGIVYQILYLCLTAGWLLKTCLKQGRIYSGGKERPLLTFSPTSDSVRQPPEHNTCAWLHLCDCVCARHAPMLRSVWLGCNYQ